VDEKVIKKKREKNRNLEEWYNVGYFPRRGERGGKKSFSLLHGIYFRDAARFVDSMLGRRTNRMTFAPLRISDIHLCHSRGPPRKSDRVIHTKSRCGSTRNPDTLLLLYTMLGLLGLHGLPRIISWITGKREMKKERYRAPVVQNNQAFSSSMWASR